jgi:hypothetical protein
VLALLAQGAFDHGLGGDAGVIGAGKPAGGVAFLPGAADEDVLDRVVEDVTHRQHPGDVGRRDDDAVGRSRGVGPAAEAAVLEPGRIPVGFDRLGIVGVGYLGCHAAGGLRE